MFKNVSWIAGRAGWLVLLALCGSAQAQTSLSIYDRVTPADEQRIQQALARRGSIEVVAAPLSDVVRQLSDQFQENIVISQTKLEEAAVGIDTPVTARLHNLPLESILSIILQELQLDFAVRDNVIIVTTPDDLNALANLETRVYPVRDLVTYADGEDYDPLIEMITTVVDPQNWDEVGGPGSIGALDTTHTLVVSQTWRTHRHIERLLETLRRAKGTSAPALPPPGAAVSTPRRSREAELPPRRYLPRPAQSWQVPLLHAQEQ